LFLSYSSLIIIPERLFNVNENISAVKAFDPEPRATTTRTPTALGPSNASDLMGLALQLIKESFIQKLPELFRRTAPSILEILYD
jgi:hypothetical protein